MRTAVLMEAVPWGFLPWFRINAQIAIPAYNAMAIYLVHAISFPCVPVVFPGNLIAPVAYYSGVGKADCTTERISVRPAFEEGKE